MEGSEPADPGPSGAPGDKPRADRLLDISPRILVSGTQGLRVSGSRDNTCPAILLYYPESNMSGMQQQYT